MASRANLFVGAEDDGPRLFMRVQEVAAATCQMPLDFPKSAVFGMHVSRDFSLRAARWVIGTFHIRACFLELVP